jgi:uncharacterized protein YcaQ
MRGTRSIAAAGASVSVETLRSFAVSRSLFPPTALQEGLDRFGFVQADPIKAPARAQDLILRHRVDGYRAGDLERNYPDLAVEEDFFINYGFVTPAVQRLMQPRARRTASDARQRRRADAVLAFVAERGAVHPREVDRHFAHGRVTNYWGGSSRATTHLLERLHYDGWLRVVRRDRGVRVYGLAVRDESAIDAGDADRRLDALVELAVRVYAPVPSTTLVWLVARMRYAAPQWRTRTARALTRARRRLAHGRVEGVDYFWPADEEARAGAGDDDRVRLLAPFDPIVWDRRRFEQLFGWAYRFEAYTPAAKRKLGYYALPLLWREQVIGWGNVAVREGRLVADVGFVEGRPPRDRRFTAALDEELARIAASLGL